MNYYRIHVAENDSERIDVCDPTFDLCDQGRAFEWPSSLPVLSQVKGRLYDWIGGWSWAPFVKQEVQERLQALLSGSVQWHGPFVVRKTPYFLLNCIRVINCALPGSNHNRMLIDENVAHASLLFRPSGFPRHLLCSDYFRDNCIQASDTGIRFGLIKADGWEELPF